jgi:hypothetical protein
MTGEVALRIYPEESFGLTADSRAPVAEAAAAGALA